MSRRAFLGSAVAACGGVAIYSLRRTTALDAQPAAVSGPVREVTIVEFSSSGERTGKVSVPLIVKTDAQWRQQLSANAYDITRHADTEIAYSGSTWNLHDRGLYRCICCETALFNSDTKFDSGTGWPSFWAPVARENVAEIEDRTLGMGRTAVSCRRCDAHLGHVFTDGPPPTGLRYCMNSASLHFVKSV